MIDGTGDPNTAQEYKDAVEALFSASYTLKFIVKKNKGVDYGVLPLEGLWWEDDMTQFSTTNKELWKWTSMIMQPEHVTKDLVNTALSELQHQVIGFRTINLVGTGDYRFAILDERLVLFQPIRP